MIINANKGGKSTKDATIKAADVSYGEIAYGKDGRIVGNAPFTNSKLVYFNDNSIPDAETYDRFYHCVTQGETTVIYGEYSIAYTTDGITYKRLYGYPSSYNTPVDADVMVMSVYGVESGNGMIIIMCRLQNINTGEEKLCCLKKIDGYDWTLHEISEDKTVLLYYANGQFFYDDNTNIFSSVDGESWQIYYTLPDNLKNSYFYAANDKIFRFGQDGLYYSDDGINFEECIVKSVNGEDWFIYFERKIIYGNGYYVTNGTTGYTYYILVSNDGINWTAYVYQDFNMNGTPSVETFYNGYFITTAGTYSENGDVVEGIMVSTDGVNWQHVKILEDDDYYATFIVHGDTILYINPSYPSGALYSNDGLNWFECGYAADIAPVEFKVALNNRTLVVTEDDIKFKGDQTTVDATITNSLELMKDVVVYDNDDKVVGTAPLSLSNVGTVGGALPGDSHRICYGNGVFVLSYCYGLMYSYDGFNWKPCNTQIGSYAQYLCYGNGVFIATGNFGSGDTYYSYDGINWTHVGMIFYMLNYATNGYVLKTCYCNNMFIMTSPHNSSKYAYSYDGINWESKDSNSGVIVSVAYGNGLYVAVHGDYMTGQNIVSYSSDGANWTKVTVPLATIWSNICYGGGKFIATASGCGECLYSEDGINWSTKSLPSASTWSSICYGNGLFVITSTNGNSIYSKNGVDWYFVKPNIRGVDVCFGDDLFVMLGSKTSHPYYSHDGITWSNQSGPTYKLEDTKISMNITAENCEERHIVVRDNVIKFEDEPTIITSTTEVTEGSASNYPENSLYVVYKEG